MAADTIKLRVPEADLEEWRAVAGYRGLSQWLRGLANAEVMRLNALAEGDPRRFRVSPPPARVLRAPDPEKTGPPRCRHGLHHCRICGNGVFGD